MSKKRFIVREVGDPKLIYGLLVCECESEFHAQRAITRAKEAVSEENEEWQIPDIIDYIRKNNKDIKKIYLFEDFDGNLYV